MSEDHPFAQYVRILGKGPKLWRNMTFEEAKDAMSMVLNDQVTPLQLGAFLLLLRRNTEIGAELAGFVAAGREHFLDTGISSDEVSFDWPSYADRHRQQPWFLLAAKCLAATGHKILMHGIKGFSEGYAPTRPGLEILDIPIAASLPDARDKLKSENLVYIGLEDFCPTVDRLFDLRPQLGVRTAVNTFARDLNPLAAPNQMQGVFHPPYCPTHIDTAQTLGQPNLMVFKGGGGEVQYNPLKPARVSSLLAGQFSELEFPALLPDGKYKWREEDLSPQQLLKLWCGEIAMPEAEAAITGTMAIALKMVLPDETPSKLMEQAVDLWQGRSRS